MCARWCARGCSSDLLLGSRRSRTRHRPRRRRAHSPRPPRSPMDGAFSALLSSALLCSRLLFVSSALRSARRSVCRSPPFSIPSSAFPLCSPHQVRRRQPWHGFVALCRLSESLRRRRAVVQEGPDASTQRLSSAASGLERPTLTTNRNGQAGGGGAHSGAAVVDAAPRALEPGGGAPGSMHHV